MKRYHESLIIKTTMITAITFFAMINYSSFAQQKINWNGYLQYRFSDNYLNQTEFSVRRAKLWVYGSMAGNDGQWSYKLQAIFHQHVKFQFLLQDVFINYRIKGFDVAAGQFEPHFSMQRKQPDYVIPLDERANVIDALVPAAETMARDIGVEFKLEDRNTGFITFGFFNGNGANTVSNQRNYLYVNRASLKLINHLDSKLELGYSLSYRDAHALQFSKIFGNNFSFTGNDFRFGFEGKLNIGGFELQSEYLEAHPGNQKASGFYVLADYMLFSKNLITFSIEQLNDLNDLTVDNPWYSIGYSYLLKNYEIKFTLENKMQFVTEKTNSLTMFQFQYFFNQK